jgi:biopolymer transport protein ExbD
MEAPRINVTPLIDVLLVLLIIFMVVTPLKPSHFNARIPSAPDQDDAIKSHPDTLIVSISMSGTLALNNEEHIGSVDDPRQMTDRLRSVFDERVADAGQHAERTVFVKAPKSERYGRVMKVIDAVKMAGATPISLQIDRLD